MNFNKEQQEIIDNIFGAYLVSAPVGTGKTTVLIERVIKALESGIKPEEVLCLTFTNRSAEEISQRIKKRIKSRDIINNLTITTFHGFCAYFVKTEAKRIGVNSDFVIFDEIEQLEIMNNILADYNYQDFSIGTKISRYEILDLIKQIYEYRLNNLRKRLGHKIEDIKISKTLIKISEKYFNALKNQNALDFNELVILTIKGLYLDEKLRNRWARRYRFIQLDEFQDTHISEYLVVKELAKTGKNISFIGDLDQTIYGWRGSEPYKIAKIFKTHFAPVKEMSLKVNYRFNQNTLDAIRSFLKSFDSAETGEMTSGEPSAEKSKQCIDVFNGTNFNEEISWVIHNIKKIQDDNPSAKIAILSRANYLISNVADIFTQKKIAHITVDKYNFFRRQEIKDVYAYLKIIFNKFDLRSAYRLILRPARNIGADAMKTIIEQGNRVGLKVSDFLNFKNYNFSEPFSNLTDKWDRGRIIVLDTETTGINVLKDEIIQIYAIELINGKFGNDFHFYLKSSLPVGDSYEIHGITDEFLQKSGRDSKEVLKELKEFISGDIVAGHNINFDLSMIEENSKRKEIDFEFKEYYDTLDLSRRLIISENYKLTTLAELLKLREATHDAKDDVLATAELLAVLVKKLEIGQKQRIELFKKFSKKFVQLSALINSWEKKAREERPAKFLNRVWEESGLKKFYEQDSEKDKRVKSINTLSHLFEQKDNTDKLPETALRELINFGSLNRDIDFLGLDNGKIPIVTAHQVKGLEFDFVFIVGVNEYKFPVYKADLEEEKRLFYVAMTRAKEKIFISYSNFDNSDKAINRSCFIDFIDKKYLNIIG
ncbi:UvrD-helicase domain-containing protein [Candidatus Parcubacteria bacterium]|nr:UvrD-helicase domain-containing protein [Candidatus Parcubacteria bacterium]